MYRIVFITLLIVLNVILSFCIPTLLLFGYLRCIHLSHVKATDGTKVEFVDPPLDSEIGERVHIDGLSTAAEPLSAAQVKKRKVFDIVAKNMKTDENGIATWEGKAICTKAGQCRAATLAGAAIS